MSRAIGESGARLDERAGLPYLADLVARKAAGTEQATLDDTDLAFHEREYRRLAAELERARDTSRLPEAPTARSALRHLLLRPRLDGL